ncbi:MAG: MBL fold metallo-hydrolase [Candidatus Marinimicrobia bacterium]|nr:MBL fold metallo-hydrolase [Candidatus Neomarinimicrobiota bacterium]MBT3633835.1 MBL fold metallo-hydrolase [Candidatus Neomarinimicrobiota bacterium]MBT3682627.1 MBL fold metallo-hydrolase [Candidatus Neomarinimicrobiota bacterium]MBT3759391.1 MBL fold metallo-hydrolase [Candidatus Neomarinimicrobiota bacterium]MBT3894601.1 MBL fold metallo-hydrolase [Candidatus Neomarinimicrobiota bacterium]
MEKIHHSEKGFRNPQLNPTNHGFKDIIKWQLNKPDDVPKYSQVADVLPVVKPDFLLMENSGNGIPVTWFGHSSLLLNIDGIKILTDPMFSERCSPVQWAGPKRYTICPIDISELPDVDIVVISHNHYDHLDKKTVKYLGNNVKWFVPLGLKKWFNNMGITNVTELDWWERKPYKNLSIVCTPAQHFSGRGLFDRNKTLWSSWAILGEKKRFWFSGDTGYSSDFKKISSELGPFDLAAIPIGAYEPRWFMNPMHVTPDQAIQIHLDIKSKQTIGIHWGTFILTDEPIFEPLELLDKYKIEMNIPPGEFVTLKHGETRIFE